MSLRIAEARPEELAASIEAFPALLLPVGTIEFHGSHLPLGLDGLKAEAIAVEAANRCGATIAPTSWWAADGVPREYTLRLASETLEPLYVSALSGFVSMGFRVIAIVNGHFGLENSRLLRRVALRVMLDTVAVVLPYADYELLLDLGDEGDHAGRWETSLLLGSRAELVHLEALADGPAPDGVIGADPREASLSEGVQGLEQAAARISAGTKRALDFGPEERADYVSALAAGLSALDGIAALRAVRPRHEVPPVLTPAWAGHLQALVDGDFARARLFAEEKARDSAA